MKSDCRRERANRAAAGSWIRNEAAAAAVWGSPPVAVVLYQAIHTGTTVQPGSTLWRQFRLLKARTCFTVCWKVSCVKCDPWLYRAGGCGWFNLIVALLRQHAFLHVICMCGFVLKLEEKPWFPWVGSGHIDDSSYGQMRETGITIRLFTRGKNTLV